ncbi:MAG: cell division protein FtsH, partial [Alphaproteobacteria bacterium]
ETRILVDTAESEARRILTEYLKDLHGLAQGLLEYETLSGEEVKAIIRGEKPDRKELDDAPRPQTSSVPTTKKPKPREGGAGLPEPQPQGA